MKMMWTATINTKSKWKYDHRSFDAIKEMETKPENKKPWITVKPRFTDIRLIRTLHIKVIYLNS